VRGRCARDGLKQSWTPAQAFTGVISRRSVNGVSPAKARI